jgi:hypothetical protein
MSDETPCRLISQDMPALQVSPPDSVSDRVAELPQGSRPQDFQAQNICGPPIQDSSAVQVGIGCRFSA